MKPKVIPGILEKEWSEIEKKLELVKSFSKTVHIDIIDGKFADNLTFLDPQPFKKYSDELFLELHMMVENPIDYLKPFATAGFKRFLGHIEHMKDQAGFVKMAKQFGEVGLALDGPTEIEKIKVKLEDLDAVLVYTSNRVGFSGPKLNPQRLEKIKDLRNKSDVAIEVDGGINDQTILSAKTAGANRFVSTSFIWSLGTERENEQNASIFNLENPQENYAKLNQLLGKNSS